MTPWVFFFKLLESFLVYLPWWDSVKLHLGISLTSRFIWLCYNKSTRPSRTASKVTYHTVIATSSPCINNTDGLYINSVRSRNGVSKGEGRHVQCLKNGRASVKTKHFPNNNKYLFQQKNSQWEGEKKTGEKDRHRLKNSGVTDTLAQMFVRWIVCESTELILDCFR